MKKLKKVNTGYYLPLNIKYPSNIIENIRQLIFVIKCMIKRSKYGVSIKDCWNLDSYFCESFRNALIMFKEESIAYPGDITQEEWDDILDRMIYLLAKMGEDEFDDEELDKKFELYLNSEPRDESLREEWIQSSLDFRRAQEDYKNEFFELMNKHFYNLWW